MVTKRRNGRSYVQRGQSIPPGWQPRKGDVLYLSGHKVTVGRVGVDDGTPYVWFKRATPDGTLAMSVGNLRQAARIEVAGAVGNPAKFRVISSFGGVVVGWHNTLAAARKNAAAQSFQGPVDIWQSKGGPFRDKRVAHYSDGKAISVKVNPVRKMHGTAPYQEGQRAYYSGYARDAALRLYLKTLTGKDPYHKLVSKREFIQGWDAIATRQAKRNPARPAGPTAIPTRWTKAKVSRVGGQIQIRMGGGR